MLLELISNEVIANHFEKLNIIKPNQQGFVKNKSCLRHLLELCNVAWRVNRGESVDIEYLDLHKAFDQVPHTLKPHGTGGSVLEWIKERLENRVGINR